MEPLEGLVKAAADGDQDAWNALVARFNGLVWSVARSFALSTADASDVVQTTWLRLVERLASIRDPERVGAWLATTARRESLRALRRAGRQIPTEDDFRLEARQPPADELDSGLIAAEEGAILWRSVEQLSEQCRRLLRVLMADPPPSYEEVSAALDMPIGSIGPTRGRCLVKLRLIVEAAGIRADARDSGD